MEQIRQLKKILGKKKTKEQELKLLKKFYKNNNVDPYDLVPRIFEIFEGAAEGTEESKYVFIWEKFIILSRALGEIDQEDFMVDPIAYSNWDY